MWKREKKILNLNHTGIANIKIKFADEERHEGGLRKEEMNKI